MGGFLRYSVVFTAALGSLMAGASVVHNIYKPDLTIPDLISAEKESKKEETFIGDFPRDN
eukprot:scaffold1884_cov343-Ochromonas_danica.AAC.46